jgi:uncharacterized protein (TIGR02246 family)
MEQTAALKDIEALITAAVERWNRHDVMGYASLWTEDSDFVNVVGIHRRGRRELQAELEWLHGDRFRNTQVRMERPSVRLLTTELALAHVEWSMTGDPGMPGFPTEDGQRRGVFTHVVQRTAEGWRFIASQNTDTLPIADPLNAD